MISVIVPVYNIDKYIERCLDSILEQTYTDFELIVVDDGSIDDSAKICDDLAQKDGRIKVFHKANGGAVSAVNVGLEHARGDLVAFIDGDDFVASDYLQTLVSAAEGGADMVCMNCTRYTDDAHQTPYVINGSSAGEYVADEAFYSEFLCWDRKQIANCRWAKLIKTDIVKKCAPYCSEAVSVGEDRQLVVGMLLNCKKIVVLDEYKYYYRYNPQSIMNSYKKDLWEKSKLLWRTIAAIPEMDKVADFDKQYNGSLILAMCDCFENEQYFGGGLKKRYFEELIAEARAIGLFSNYKTAYIGKMHERMIEYMRKGAFIRLKTLLRVKKMYNRLRGIR